MTDPLEQLTQSIKESVAQKYAGTDYTNSYVAFLDILGMKQLVNRPYLDLRAIFNAAESGMELYGRIQVPDGNQFINQEHLKMTIMSDALVMSIDSGIQQSFSKLIGFSSYLINNLLTALEAPVFMRGGITRGLIFQDGRTVFGPGLVDAYNLENEIAMSMRCIISPELQGEDTVQEYLASPDSALVLDPEDQLYFINFTRPELLDRLKAIASQVIESDTKDDIKNKYRWLSSYLEGRAGA